MKNLRPSRWERIFKAFRWFCFGNKAQRNRVKQEMARVALKFFGEFSLSDSGLLWLQDKQFRQDYRRLSPLSAYSEDRKFILRELAACVSNLEGEIAECGSYQGASAFFIAQTCKDTPIHLFDAFEGLPAPGEFDRAMTDEVASWELGDLKTSENVLKENLSQFKNIQIHKGWIPDRFQEVSNKRFRFVHVDVDLYEPTRDSLEFFYPRMVAHGIMVLDDYGFLKCPGVGKAADDFMKNKAERLVRLTSGQAFFVKR
jgi:hypothetical protein